MDVNDHLNTMQGRLVKGLLNTKFKTTMCRFYEADEVCQMGERCHFAHGKDDLRRMNDVKLTKITFSLFLLILLFCLTQNLRSICLRCFLILKWLLITKPLYASIGSKVLIGSNP